MALSATGYFTTGTQPGLAGTNGNYYPVIGVNATYSGNGSTQFTNGTYFLTFNNSGYWAIYPSANVVGGILYQVPTGSATTFALTGWTTQGGTAPAPTFAEITASPSSISGFSVISGINSISF